MFNKILSFSLWLRSIFLIIFELSLAEEERGKKVDLKLYPALLNHCHAALSACVT